MKVIDNQSSLVCASREDSDVVLHQLCCYPLAARLWTLNIYFYRQISKIDHYIYIYTIYHYIHYSSSVIQIRNNRPDDGIDYRCDDQVSASWLSSLNPPLLSSSETWANFRIQSKKKCLSELAQCQQAIGDIYFTETWRPEAIHHGLKIVKSQPQTKVGNFECMSWLNGSFFGLNIQVFWKRESRPI